MKKIRIAQIGTSRNSHGCPIWRRLLRNTDIFDMAGYARVNWMLLLAVTIVGAVISGILIYKSSSNKGPE